MAEVLLLPFSINYGLAEGVPKMPPVLQDGAGKWEGRMQPFPLRCVSAFFLLCRSLNLQSVENVMGNQPTENAIIHIILSSFILSAIVMIRQAAWQC